MFARLRRRRRRMTCRRVTELVTDYLDGALDPAERARFEAHLAQCDGCTAYLEQMRATVGALREIDVAELPDDLRDEFVGLYRRYRNG